MRSFPLPVLFRQKIPSGPVFFKLLDTLSQQQLHTVCEEAKCPNRTDCYARGTLTLQILGDLCTRHCNFCAEKTGVPLAPELDEPQRILKAVKELKLKHLVLTAPARDDLKDGGASQFAQTINLLKNNLPDLTIEILISDLKGDEESLKIVLESKPNIFNHNIETVERLTQQVRAKATYSRSLKVLKNASLYQPNIKTKSGIMVGLGESLNEMYQTLLDLRKSKAQLLTVGQYLQPSFKHLPVQKFYTLEEFNQIKKMAEELGFEKIFCGPKIRSSFHADEMIYENAH
ncbi:MAG: lipoyl synthase [Elusimicrobia bacterium RIFCSPLOWO2_02_FULL_39_32]|nr:MAG: lipoyl synthase [Elusimicrobia bacterium GWA2_38_7]OGR81254.1 MAG: lipoyl synthase [Elusimicrobia bacterium RIFCSPHIGHO2_02_FULL_39_36]OGR91806.1 MAG: lipoyl synthase [Elusimicrobia bacterium RIFCSPLOWO2_02_FULL_39_32]OGR98465.1 MAG: lipoyl synthase [Elusimicrobia bacterium RIFCSPLOWO2_12_FULL_39_28]